MPRRYAANSLAPPEVAWSLLAEPDRWHEWAPHVRGAWGLGSPEVLEKKIGVARLFGLVPVPAQIVHKKPGRSWTWRFGPVVLVHTVKPRGSGSQVSVVLQAPEPIETLVAATYGPVM